MKSILACILLLILITNTSFFYSIKLNKKIEQTIFLTIASYTTILFIFGLFNNIGIGFYSILIINLVLLIYNLNSLRLNRSLKEYILTPGYGFFILAFIFFAYICLGRSVYQGDEFSHWALKVKNIYYFNTINITKYTTVFFDYISGTCMFNYFCTKLSGSYKEDLMYFGNNLIIISLLIPATSFFRKKNLMNYLLFFVILFVPTIVFGKIYDSLFVDGVLGLCFGYGLYSYFLNREDRKFNAINLTAIMAMLILIKESGLLLAIILYLIVIIYNKIENKTLFKNNKDYLLSIIPALVITVAWKTSLKLSAAYITFRTFKPTDSLHNLLTLNLLPYQKEAIVEFIRSFATKPILNSSTTYLFPMITVIVLLLGVGLLVLKIYKKDKKNEKIVKYLFIVSIISVFVFAIGLLMLYLVSFTEYEAMRSASFQRYMRTPTVGILLLFTVLIIKKLYDNKSDMLKYIIIGAIAVSIFYDHMSFLNLTFLARREINKNNTLLSSHEYIKRIDSALTKDDKLLFIANNYDKGISYYTSKYILGTKQLILRVWSIGEPQEEGDIWTVNFTKDEFKEYLLNNVTHVYIYKYNESFINLYKDLFKDEIQEDKLYKVVDEGGEAILQLVEC